MAGHRPDGAALLRRLGLLVEAHPPPSPAWQLRPLRGSAQRSAKGERMTQLSTHTLYKSADHLDAFTVRFFETLVGKAGLYIREHRTTTLRTFTLHQSRLTFTPDTDETRATEDVK